MKKIYKKGIYLAGSAIAISLPISTIIACAGSSQGRNWVYDEDKKIVEDISGKDFNADVKAQGVTQQDVTTKANHEVANFLYQEEQSGSLKLQSDWFSWELTDIEEQLTDLTDNPEKDHAKDPSKQSLVDDLNSKKTKTTDFKEKANNNTINYESSSFAQDYPKVLLPINTIRDRQQKIFDDQKNAFLNQYDDRAKAEEEWINQRSTNFEGATTDAEAVDGLVFKQIQSNANTQFDFAVNSEFTYKQYVWAQKSWTETDPKNQHFTFLKQAKTKSPSSGSAVPFDSSKVYFLGTQSRNPDKIAVDLQQVAGAKNRTLSIIDSQNLRLVRHFLLNIKQNTGGSTLAWTVDIETIKKLLAFLPAGITSGSGFQNDGWEAGKTRVFEQLSQVFVPQGTDTNTFNGVNVATDTLLKKWSDNAGAATTQGSLGIQPLSYFNTQMMDGFAMGLLALENKRNTIASVNEPNPAASKVTAEGIIDKLETTIHDAAKEYFDTTSTKWDSITNQRQLTEAIGAADATKLGQVFGEKIRQLFGAGDLESGTKLVYFDDDDAKRAVVVSAGAGVHIVNDIVVNSDQLALANDKDLQLVADQQKSDSEIQSVTQYNIPSLIQSYFTNINVLESLINEDPTGTNDKSYVSFLKKQFADGKLKLDDYDDIDTVDKFVASALKTISDQKNAKAAQDAEGVSGHAEWYIGELDKKNIRTATATDQLDPEQIYELGYKMSGGK